VGNKACLFVDSVGGNPRPQASKVPAKEWSPEFRLKFLYHVRLVRMLATCCEGDNRFIHSMCQNIFTLDELFEVDPRLPTPTVFFFAAAKVSSPSRCRQPSFPEWDDRRL